MIRQADHIRATRTGTWARYTWNLRSLLAPFDPFSYRLRPAHPRELQLILKVVRASYESDPAWAPFRPWVQMRMRRRVRATLGGFRVDYLVAESAGRIVGVCGVADLHWAGVNVLTGVCLLPQHRQGRLGTALLEAALVRLKSMGIRQATACTRSGSYDDIRHFPHVPHWREVGGPWVF